MSFAPLLYLFLLTVRVGERSRLFPKHVVTESHGIGVQ